MAAGCDRSVIGANGQNPADGKSTSRSLVTTATELLQTDISALPFLFLKWVFFRRKFERRILNFAAAATLLADNREGVGRKFRDA